MLVVEPEFWAKVAAIDGSEAMVGVARQRLPSCDVRLADLEALPFQSPSFDSVVAVNSLFFARDVDAATREVARVLDQGAGWWRIPVQRRHKRRFGPIVRRRCALCWMRSRPATPAQTERSLLKMSSYGQPASVLDRTCSRNVPVRG